MYVLFLVFTFAHVADKTAISVACQESDIRYVRALIVGPPGTPYAYGFFEFLVKFDANYPSTAPKVDAKTTNRGRTRFNPNIYAGGKVCLSILGTWHGERGEEWSSAQGLESVLLSIQSLMSDNPYENEPGYENNKSEEDKKVQAAYCAKVWSRSYLDQACRVTCIRSNTKLSESLSSRS